MTTLNRSRGRVSEALELLRRPHVRLVSIFGSVDQENKRRVHYIVEVDNREYRVLELAVDGPILSATSITPSAAWYERELHDRYGIDIEGHPDLRPLIYHHADESAAGMVAARPISEDRRYPQSGLGALFRSEYQFLRVKGEGVCEVPVGPVHAGIIEPGHFRFSVVGDSVLNLELRHFYTHKGTEQLFEGTSVMNGPLIAESVSGDNCFAHAVAYSQAVENAFGVAVPPRGRAIRLVGLELERMMAHIADVGALCGDVGFTVPAAYTARIKESLLQVSSRVFGTRFWRGIAVPGGVKLDWSAEHASALSTAVAEATRDFAELARIILETPSVQNRFETTGILKRQAALDLSVVGPAARASGIVMDVRRDHPYGRYREVTLDVPHYHYGDVLARARVRIDETMVSARLIADTLRALPTGDICIAVPCNRSADGLSAVESPRGELLYWIRVRNGSIARCHIKSPSFQNWPALPLAMPGNIIADFPLINKSFNLSYSGCDR